MVGGHGDTVGGHILLGMPFKFFFDELVKHAQQRKKTWSERTTCASSRGCGGHIQSNTRRSQILSAPCVDRLRNLSTTLNRQGWLTKLQHAVMSQSKGPIYRKGPKTSHHCQLSQMRMKMSTTPTNTRRQTQVQPHRGSLHLNAFPQ